MNIGEKFSGFILNEKCYIEDIAATLYIFLYERTATPLYYLSRDDECKSFAIAFKTVPKDDTGVFHIIEHSVLCGSRKYPLKDPFTEVMKGSVNVFMNAFTAPDKTVYPIASMNETDFHNLIDVYMDAVLNPLALTDKNIFMREGIRIEFDENGKPHFNGVVYNEMKGAYASVDEAASYQCSRLLYKNGTYSFDTGGNPVHIPALSFEEFKEAYNEFYHPTNASIFLDGKMDLLPVLKKLNGYLCSFNMGKSSGEIILGEEVITEKQIGKYASEDESGKGYLYLCSRFSEFDKLIDNTAAAILADCLSDSNDAPLKKAVLSLNLCDNFYFSTETDLKYCSADSEFIGVKDGMEDELVLKYGEICRKLCKDGIDNSLIESSINSMEFKTKEADYGRMPRGLVYMGSCIDGWCYGVHPKELLSYGKIFAELRQRLSGNYFNNLLSRLLLPAKQTELLMLADSNLLSSEENAADKRCRDIVESMSKPALEALKAETSKFEAWQNSEESEEDLNKIPRLSLNELKNAPKEIPCDACERDGVKILRHPLVTCGIIYTELHFDVSDVPSEKIPKLQLLAMLLSEFRTESGAPNVFRTRKKAKLGSLYSSIEPIKAGGEPKLYFTVRASALSANQSELVDCIREYLFTAVFDDKDAIRKKLKQIAAASKEALAASGSFYAIQRACARYDRFEALKELVQGFSFRKWVCLTEKNFDSKAEEIIADFEYFKNSFFKKERLTISVTSEVNKELEKALISIIPKGAKALEKPSIQTLPKKNEAIALSSPVSFSARATNLSTVNERYTGAMATLSKILSLSILLEEIRLRGGAYDTGFVARANSGSLVAYSYRDPTPLRSVKFFAGIGKRIREFLNQSPDITGYIISTIGNLDSLSTPRADGAASTQLYLSNISYADTVRIRNEALSTDSSELIRLSYILDEAMKSSTVCVVGSKDTILGFGIEPENILEL